MTVSSEVSNFGNKGNTMHDFIFCVCLCSFYSGLTFFQHASVRGLWQITDYFHWFNGIGCIYAHRKGSKPASAVSVWACRADHLEHHRELWSKQELTPTTAERPGKPEKHVAPLWL